MGTMSMSSWRAAQEPGFFGYPDDDEACIQHGNNKETCPACLEDFRREEAEYLAWRDTQPAPSTADFADLPY
jgi:hypothetical protein